MRWRPGAALRCTGAATGGWKAGTSAPASRKRGNRSPRLSRGSRSGRVRRRVERRGHETDGHWHATQRDGHAPGDDPSVATSTTTASPPSTSVATVTVEKPTTVPPVTVTAPPVTVTAPPVTVTTAPANLSQHRHGPDDRDGHGDGDDHDRGRRQPRRGRSRRRGEGRLVERGQQQYGLGLGRVRGSRSGRGRRSGRLVVAQTPCKAAAHRRRLSVSRRASAPRLPTARGPAAASSENPKGLLTTSLTGSEWLACFGLAALLPVIVESGKWLRRRRAPSSGAMDPRRALGPARAT